jgi:AbrB family looped-hinge helix DNA binding protein
MDEVISATGDYQYRALKRLEGRGYRIRRKKEGRVTRYWAIAPATESYDVTVSADGKITLPKEVRSRLGVGKGGKLRLTSEEDGRIVVTHGGHSILDFVGILPKPKRAVTLEEMDEAIKRGAVERYLRSKW